VAIEFATLSPHDWLHPPQLFGSVILLTHELPHWSGVAPPQFGVQEPPEQSGVAPVQATVHEPQALAVFSCVGQPAPLSAQSP
jgi:hypothetical protein